MLIEQALYGSRDAAGYRFLARSPGFRDDWLPEAERLCTDFGERPAGVTCPGSVFALPLGARHVAVVQVADKGTDDAGRPGTLTFRILAVPRELYDGLGGDPFLIADAFPQPADSAAELPTLTWTSGPPPRRTVETLRKVLDVPQSAVLLGGAQALLDGGRLVFERREPADNLVRSLWALLPTNSRCRLWPATLVYSKPSRFHVAVVPRADDPALASYVDEVRAGDYPEGRYELALQMAVEGGDQEELDSLLSRRSRRQVFALGLALLGILVVGAFALGTFSPRDDHPPATAKDASKPQLPPADECPRLDAAERERFSARLTALGKRFGLDIPPADSEAALAKGLQELDDRIGPSPTGRDPGRLSDLGPIQRQLRALLWKHSVPGYDARGANTVELLEKLEGKVAAEPRMEANP